MNTSTQGSGMSAEAGASNVIGAIDRTGHMDSFKLKVLAIIGMTANHVAHVIGSYLPWQLTLALYCLGGVTYATMAFLMVEGYLHTSNLRKYAMRLGIFALVSQIPFSLCFGAHANVLFTLLLGLGLCWSWDTLRHSIFAIVLVAVTAVSYFCDWAFVGPAMVWLFYVLRDKGTRGVILTMLLPYAYMIGRALISLIPNVQAGLDSGAAIVEQGLADSYRMLYVAGIPIQLTGRILRGCADIGYALVGFTIAIICISQYNGKRGRPMKWFFYAYYPAHLLVIWGIKQLLQMA